MKIIPDSQSASHFGLKVSKLFFIDQMHFSFLLKLTVKDDLIISTLFVFYIRCIIKSIQPYFQLDNNRI